MVARLLWRRLPLLLSLTGFAQACYTCEMLTAHISCYMVLGCNISSMYDTHTHAAAAAAAAACADPLQDWCTGEQQLAQACYAPKMLVAHRTCYMTCLQHTVVAMLHELAVLQHSIGIKRMYALLLQLRFQIRCRTGALMNNGRQLRISDLPPGRAVV
jgi:hypothetical protein